MAQSVDRSDVQKDAEAISRLIKERITPLPQFILKPLQEDGKNLLALEVSPGRSTPYYYKADGVMEAYIRVGNESCNPFLPRLLLGYQRTDWFPLRSVHSQCNQGQLRFHFQHGYMLPSLRLPCNSMGS